MTDMPKNYTPSDYAQQLEALWASLEHPHHPEQDNFSITLPPPNVTGSHTWAMVFK